MTNLVNLIFFFSSRRRHTRYIGDWSSDVCSSDLRPDSVGPGGALAERRAEEHGVGCEHGGDRIDIAALPRRAKLLQQLTIDRAHGANIRQSGTMGRDVWYTKSPRFTSTRDKEE